MNIEPWEIHEGGYVNHETGEIITAEEFHSVDEKERV